MRMPGKLVMATPANTWQGSQPGVREDIKAQVEHRVSHPSPLTALPMKIVASLALSSRVGLVLTAKDRVRWDTNSTDMPTAYKQEKELQATREKMGQGRGAEVQESKPGRCLDLTQNGVAYESRFPTAKTRSAGYRDKVDEGHSIVADTPHSHEANGVHEDHNDGEQVEDA